MSIKNRINCEFITEQLLGKVVKVSGWVNKRRDHGGLIFIDLRDRSGILQIIFDRKFGTFKEIETLRNEYVIEVVGTVRKRSKDNINLTIKTGRIELMGSFIKIINKSKTPIFEIDDNCDIDENIRLKYRYLDLRRSFMQKKLILRHQTTIAIRNFLDKKGFLEIETPILGKSTPEGARDYLVPSRNSPGLFFALPQSPQQYKQMLMVGGIEKYFQIARCFRDEDLRADRQPEFTQLDIEISFIKKEDIIFLITEMMQHIFKKILKIKLPKIFPIIKYSDAINIYGSDHPDLRFDLKLENLTKIFKNTSFNIFKNIIKKGGVVKGINAKNSSKIISRRDIDKLTEFVTIHGCKGLSWIEITKDSFKSNIIKFISKEEIGLIMEEMDAREGDILFLVADSIDYSNNILGALRIEIAQKMNLIDPEKLNFTWIIDFPLLKYDENKKNYSPVHHMFTHPNIEDIKFLKKEPEKVKSLAYDLVLNGIEIGGGSIRIYKKDLQEKIFNLIGLNKEEIEKDFGFLLKSFTYGAPPHGGIAFGLDRLIMIMGKCKNIRDVIAFPKIQNASDLLFSAPSKVNNSQLDDLFIKLKSF